MRILVLNYEFPPVGGGAAPVCKDLALQLQSRGHEITVVTMGFENLPTFEEIQGVRVYRLPCLRKKKNVCKPWEQYSYLLAVRFFMRQHMKTHCYDVCHVHFVVPTGEAAKWIWKKYGIPYIITAHGSDVEGHNRKVSMKIMHRLLRNGWRGIVNGAYAVISPSQYLIDLMRRNYSCDKYIYIPNGIEWSKWHKCAKIEYKQNKILIMGRLQKFKNVQMILHALSQIELGSWQVDILGDGPYRQELERLAIELDLAEQVRFHGWIDHGTDEQKKFLKEALVYISASQFENCPMSVIEAAASGCIPLLSDIPAHRQLIAESKYYFQLDNSLELEEKIKSVIAGRQQGKSVKGIERYDWSAVVTQYEEELQRASESIKKLHSI